MARSAYPAGIRPRGNGLQIRLYVHGKEYSETIYGEPTAKSTITAASKRLDELKSRIRLGLQIRQEDPVIRRRFDQVAGEYMK